MHIAMYKKRPLEIYIYRSSVLSLSIVKKLENRVWLSRGDTWNTFNAKKKKTDKSEIESLPA